MHVKIENVSNSSLGWHNNYMNLLDKKETKKSSDTRNSQKCIKIAIYNCVILNNNCNENHLK